MTVPSSKPLHWLASNPFGSNPSTGCYSRIERVGCSLDALNTVARLARQPTSVPQWSLAIRGWQIIDTCHADEVTD
jgi:hypothetical protein